MAKLRVTIELDTAQGLHQQILEITQLPICEETAKIIILEIEPHVEAILHRVFHSKESINGKSI